MANNLAHAHLVAYQMAHGLGRSVEPDRLDPKDNLTMLKRIARKIMPRRLHSTLALNRMLRALSPLRTPVASHAHGLPGELIVSLTSYPPRFGNLHLTLESLLNQTVAADRVILWLASADMNKLSWRTLRLRKRGLELRSVPDVRSYKKLVFGLEAYPDAYIATADDDVFYKPDWLAALVDGCEHALITCHRAHRIPGFHKGLLSKYRTWEWDAEDDAAREPSADIVPTGVGGVLYPPHSMDSSVTDSAIFMNLCPHADDLWFYFMARKAGSLHKKVGEHFELLTWPYTQEVALTNRNLDGNDEQMARLVEHYGHPATLGVK